VAIDLRLVVGSGEIARVLRRVPESVLPVPHPQRNRIEENLCEDQLHVLRMSRRTLASAPARALMRRRGELCERSFQHTLNCGGARRTTLRGRDNILKRYLIQAATMNMALLLRVLGGIGTLKQTWAAFY